MERKLKSKESDELIINDYKLTEYYIFENETLDQLASRVMKELTVWAIYSKNNLRPTETQIDL